MSSRALLSAALWCGLACDEPASPRVTAPEQAPAARGPDVAAVPSSAVQPADPQLAIAIARGREAFTDKDYAAAVIAFDAAALLAPADPRVLSELGWALLHAKDLVRAQSVLSLAVSLASEGRVAGAAWYNLGRVREAQGRRDEAAKAYETSLALRESKAVRQRLAQVHTPAADDRPKLDMEPLQGPVPTLDAWCAEEARHEDIEAEFLGCELDVRHDPEFEVKVAELDATEGILEARFVSRLHDLSFDGFRLAVRTEAGWFVGRRIASHGMRGAGGIHFVLEHLAIEAVDIAPGRGPELLVRAHQSTLNLDVDGRSQFEDHADDRYVCGVGPSGVPACTSPIPLVGESLVFDADEQPTSEERWALELRVVTGAVVLSGAREKLDAHHRAWLGKHAIAFP